MSGHVVSLKTYGAVFAALMALLAITVGVAYVQLGRFNVVAALTIAVVKALIIILYFMHVRYSPRLTWIFVSAGFFWLLILLSLLSTDYISRDWLPVPAGWEDAR